MSFDCSEGWKLSKIMPLCLLSTRSHRGKLILILNEYKCGFFGIETETFCFRTHPQFAPASMGCLVGDSSRESIYWQSDLGGERAVAVMNIDAGRLRSCKSMRCCSQAWQGDWTYWNKHHHRVLIYHSRLCSFIKFVYLMMYLRYLEKITIKKAIGINIAITLSIMNHSRRSLSSASVGGCDPRAPLWGVWGVF